MAYDYREAMKADIKEWLSDNLDYFEDNIDDINNKEEVYQFLYDTLWTEDSVTGNASGSYTCDRWQAGEYVGANMGLAVQAFREFDSLKQFVEKLDNEDWEFIDVTIRCYLLGEIIEQIIEEDEDLRKGC